MKKRKIKINKSSNIKSTSKKNKPIDINKIVIDKDSILKNAIVIFSMIIAIILIIAILPHIIVFFFPIVIGYIIALIANPIVNGLYNKFKFNRQQGSLILVVIISIIIFVIFYLLITTLYSLSLKLTNDLPTLVYEINGTIEDFQNLLNETITTSKRTIEFPRITYLNVMNLINNYATDTFSGVMNFLKSIPNVIVSVVFVIASAYMFIIENKTIKDTSNIFISSEIYDYYLYIKQESRKIFNGWFKAQLIVAFLVFVILLIGLGLMNVKYYVIIAFLIALIDALPIFGSGLFIWPWCILSLLRGEYYNLIILIIVYSLIQFVRNIVQNKIMSKEMGLNGFATILFLYVGYRIYGFIGLIFAIPIGMFILSLYNFGSFNNLIYNFVQIYLKLKKFILNIR